MLKCEHFSVLGVFVHMGTEKDYPNDGVSSPVT